MAEEYETDPDEAKPSLVMRRRRASDNEEEAGDAGGEKSPRPLLARSDSRNGTGSDGDSDGQGGVAKYDDEEEAADDEVEEDGDEDDYAEVDYGGFAEGVDADYHDGGVDVEGEGVEMVKVFDAETSGMFSEAMTEGSGEGQVGVEEIKKENEPYAVPTDGAFYMHDDRFRVMFRGRNRRTLGGRRLWESKDNRKWGHDKFEEMAVQEGRCDEEKKSSKGQYWIGSRIHGSDNGCARGGRSRLCPSNAMPDTVIKDFRGGGPKRFGKALARSSQASSHGIPASVSNGFTNPVPAKNQAFTSSLSSASPPFYPSSSSIKKVTVSREKGLQAGASNDNSQFQVAMSQSSALLSAGNIIDGTCMEKLYVDDFAPSANIHLRHSGFSSWFQWKGSSHCGQMPFQLNPSHNQASRAPPTRPHTGQKSPAHAEVQPLLQPPSQASVLHSGGGSQSSPKTSLSFQQGETESGNALIGKGRGGAQVSGRDSFIYGGATRSMGVGHGDKKFPTTPAFLPVMQLADKHPGGIGVPAVGMAFPGYVSQPQLGLGNSEVAWLPVLAGAGALGASCCSPYMAADDAFQTCPSGPTSSAGASSEKNSTCKPNNEWKRSSRLETVADEFERRQNKPRRYSEMSFGH